MGTIARTLRSLLFPIGRLARVYRGPLRGAKFTVTSNSGWSPIFGRWEPGAQELFSKAVRPGDRVFDIGANAGIHSLLFAKLTGPKGRVVSFEPNPSVARELMLNLAANSIANVVVDTRAIADKEGLAEFVLADHAQAGALADLSQRSNQSVTQVEVSTLDAATRRYGEPHFVKIDVEGAESAVLIGGKRVLSASRPLISIELHSERQATLVEQILTEASYAIYRFDPWVHRFPELKRIPKGMMSSSIQDGDWGTILALPVEACPNVVLRN